MGFLAMKEGWIFFFLTVLISTGIIRAQEKKESLTLGIEYFDQGDLEKADSLFQEILKTQPDHELAHYYRGQVYYRWQKWQDAEAEFLRVVQLNPRSPQAHYFLGMVYLKLEKRELAKQAFNTALALKEDYAEAYNGLGLLYAFKPQSKFYVIQAVKKMFNRDEQAKAINYFNKALQINPDYLEARLNLGLAYLLRGDDSNVRKAKEAFAEVIKKDPSYDDVYFHLARAYRILRRFSDAIMVLRDLIKLEPDHYKAKMELAQIYFQLGEGQLASMYFMKSLKGLRDEDMLEDIYHEAEPIATDQEKKEYKNCSLEEKGPFLKKFWLSRDPDLTTKVNERLIEHYRRLNYAKIHFPTKSPRGYDDRGLIYIKYGEPDEKFVSAVDLGEAAKGNESWLYRKIKGGLIFDFVEKGSAYWLARDLREAVASGVDETHKLRQMARLYRERSHLDSRYAMIASALENARSRAEFNRAMLDMDIVTAKISQARKEAPPERFEPARKENVLYLVNRWAQFRGDNDSTRIEFYYGIFNRQLQFKPYFQKGYRTLLFANLAISDTMYNMVRKERKRISLKTSSEEDIARNISVNQEDFYLASGWYKFAFRLETPEKDKIGLYQTDLVVRDFSGDSLKISDIQFAFKVEPAQAGDKFVKNRLKVTPFPFSMVRKERPLFIYYEIYNLKTDAAGKTHYQVEHNITVVAEKKGRGHFLARLFRGSKKKSISSIYEREGNNPTGIEYISFNLKKLPLGKCLLKVVVKDLNSGQQVQSVTRFELAD